MHIITIMILRFQILKRQWCYADNAMQFNAMQSILNCLCTIQFITGRESFVIKSGITSQIVDTNLHTDRLVMLFCGIIMCMFQLCIKINNNQLQVMQLEIVFVYVDKELQ